MDAGATWFRDYKWSVGGTPVDLTNYKITVCFFYKTRAVALGPYTVGNGVTITPVLGEFEIRVPSTDNAKFQELTTLTMRVDLTRINSDDPLTEYKKDEIASLITGTLRVYPKHAGK